MTKLICALGLIPAFALAPMAAPSVALAAPDVSVAFGNTVVSTYPDGRKAHLWMKADGSYTATGRRGKPSSGTWSIKGDKVCLKQKKPTSAPFTYCTAAPTGGVGTSWKAKAVTGEPITVTVVKG
jgi:hypothetical protein